jgi:YqcI/YcgG family
MRKPERYPEWWWCLMDGNDAINDLEELIHTETVLIGDLRDPLDISRQLSAQVVKISKNLEEPRGQSRDSGIDELFLLAATLASRYRIPLSDIVSARGARDAHGVSDPRDPNFCKALLAMARETDDTVRAYEGGILPPPEKDGVTPGACLADVVEKAFSAADLKDANLCDAVSDLIREKRDRAAASEYLYHPSDAPTLRSFETIQRETACPYAKAARLWGAPPWDRDKSIEDNVSGMATPLGRFVHLQRWEILDGFVIEVSDDRLVGDMQSLSRTLRSILKSLNLLDCFKPNLFDREVRSSDWNFEFQGARMFLIVFSPLYDHQSSRETYGEKSTFIMLQPQRSIWNKVLRDDEKIEQEKKENRSVLVEIFSRRFANIRQRFADIGKPYDGPIQKAPFQAPRYIKPLRLGDPEIEWWKDD